MMGRRNRLITANSSAATAQVESLGSQIAAAEAQAQAVQHQIEKLTLHAPMDGVVLRRSIKPGEVAAPGAQLMTIGDIAHLTITVYVPEDRYGEIHLGQAATLQVDSFPTESFTTTVTRIADQAEFTPRNVQTAERHATTVFAIEPAVQHTAGKLKSGMPADVYFGQ